jgi:hypothetical protein
VAEEAVVRKPTAGEDADSPSRVATIGSGGGTTHSPEMSAGTGDNKFVADMHVTSAAPTLHTTAASPAPVQHAPKEREEMPGRGGAGQSLGSQFDLQHGVRAMRVYPVTDSDMYSLKLTGALASVFFTIGGAIEGIGINIRISSSFYETLPPQAQVMVGYMAPICLWGGGAFLAAAAVAEIVSFVTWNGIRRSTKFQGISAGPQ